MKKHAQQLLVPLLLLTLGIATAQNPIIRNQFAADPTAKVFGDRVYLYPSHDILAAEGRGKVGWFCMEDYHVFSSADLTEWTDHGVLISQTSVPWVKPDGYSMWAPDCIERNGKYYFYFPTLPKDTLVYGRGFRIGVAVADKPTGPFIPQAEPIKEVRGVDPNVFIDKDGQAYLYWSAGNIYGAKLQANMLELASPVKTLGELPVKGLKEGPYLFERNGIYYLTYPHVENKIQRLEYASSNSPLGPFKYTGVIMDESLTGCWTNHQSIIQFKNQWYLFYHHNDYSPAFDKARSARIDSLFFNADGTIQKVKPTFRGVAVTDAAKEIQIDRYTQISDAGTAISFLDTLNRFMGWKTNFSTAGAWLQYNSVGFGRQRFTTVVVKAMAETGGTLQIRTGTVDGPLLAEVTIDPGREWKQLKTVLIKAPRGIQHLFVSTKKDGLVAVDWIQFQ